MIEGILKDSQARMAKSIEVLKAEFAKIRTGRAHPSILDHITVDYYGNPAPLNQVAAVTVGDARTLVVTPWEKTMVAPIEKAILNSGLGLNPATAGTVIRVPMPPLNEERRKDMVRIVRAEAENGRVSVRNIRRVMNQHFKDLLKAKKITEDDAHRAEEKAQKLTDQFIKDLDHVLAQKEADLMAV